MREYILLNTEFVFSDYNMGRLSPQAILYYIKLNAYANKGFVSNPIEILDGMGYDKSVLVELVKSECVLIQENRSEIFITAYYVHNRGMKYKETFTSVFWTYWKGKLWFKENGMATLKKQEQQQNDPPANSDNSWDNLLNKIDNEHLA